MGPSRKCITEGCPNYALETKDTCGGCTAGGSIAAPAMTAPRPSDAAMRAAESLLLVPSALGRMATAVGELTKGLQAVCEDMEALVKSITPPEGRQTPRVFFLNEAHETHVTKSQSRRERHQAVERRKSTSKAPRTSRVARKPRAGGSRRR